MSKAKNLVPQKRLQGVPPGCVELLEVAWKYRAGAPRAPALGYVLNESEARDLLATRGLSEDSIQVSRVLFVQLGGSWYRLSRLTPVTFTTELSAKLTPHGVTVGDLRTALKDCLEEIRYLHSELDGDAATDSTSFRRYARFIEDADCLEYLPASASSEPRDVPGEGDNT